MSEWGYGHDGVSVCITYHGKFVPIETAAKRWRKAGITASAIGSPDSMGEYMDARQALVASLDGQEAQHGE